MNKQEFLDAIKTKDAGIIKILESESSALTYTKTGYCTRGGAAKGARQVHGLTIDERQKVRAGQRVYLANCLKHLGETDRVIVPINGRFYTRMP